MGAIVRYLLARFGEVVLEWSLREILQRLNEDRAAGRGDPTTGELEDEDKYFWDDENPCEWEDPCH